MSGEKLYSIGEVARRTGLTVKTIRYYSDAGLVPPAGRSDRGYRRYEAEAVARLELIRTLRELGLDLATIRRIAQREAALPEVAAAHADAVAVQIRTLRLRYAVLTAAAAGQCTAPELDRMHKLVQLSGEQRRALVDDFLAAVFDGIGERAEFAG